MAPSLPRAEEKNIHVGHIAFAGHGATQTAVRFVRGNLFIKVESVGPKHADVKDLAEAIDERDVIASGRIIGKLPIATHITTIESCRRRGVEPYAYLREVLTRLRKLTNN